MLKNYRRSLTSLIAALLLTAICLPTGAEEHLKKHIKGSLKNDVYTSQLKDFRVHIPVYETAGGAVSDEYGKREDMEMEQVIFTDDFGSFYRIVSLKTSRPMESVMNVFRDIRDKQELQTERGREFRVIDVEKEGSHITITTIEAGSPPKTVRPDLVTANVIFAANGRIYHLVAGYMSPRNGKPEDIFNRLRKQLDELLKGFEVGEGGKK